MQNNFIVVLKNRISVTCVQFFRKICLYFVFVRFIGGHRQQNIGKRKSVRSRIHKDAAAYGSRDPGCKGKIRVPLPCGQESKA